MRGGDLRRYSRVNQKMQMASTRARRGLSSVWWLAGLLGRRRVAQTFFYQKLAKNQNLESEGNLCLMLGIVFRVIPTVETTTKMKEMKETACW